MQESQIAECFSRFKNHCKKYGLKITPQRCAVYRKLLLSRDHPTADEMFNSVKIEFPNISYDTVNRTLLTFTEIGLADVVQTKGGPRRFDIIMDSHHHFHCVRCGKVVDFCHEEYDNIGIPENIRKDSLIYTKRVVLNGLCRPCRKKSGAGSAAL